VNEREQIEEAISKLAGQRSQLGDAVVEAAVAALSEKLTLLERSQQAQRKQLTILFADIANYTAWSEAVDAEDVADALDALWAELDAIVRQFGGVVDKHLGDGLLALFGAAVSHEDDSQQAVRAALAMQTAFASFSLPVEMNRRSLPELGLRVGVHTGPVLLTTIGTRGEYTVVGDSVNLAARLQQTAPSGGVVISQDVYRQVRGGFQLRRLEPLALKGKSEAVQAYLARGERPRPLRVSQRGVEGVVTTMVGRDGQLARLKHAHQEVLEGNGLRLLTIVAEAGMGKSRLLQEFNIWFDLTTPTVWYFCAQAEQNQSNVPYGLLREMLALRFDILDNDPLPVVCDKFVRGVASFLGPESEEQAQVLGQLLGFDFSDSPAVQERKQSQRQLHDDGSRYFASLMQAALARFPVMLLLDDLHWADAGSLALLTYLAQQSQSESLLIIAASRPILFEEQPQWGAGLAGYQRIDLTPLSQEESRSLARDILRPIPQVPGALLDLISDGAEGNPFYIEEIIKMLIEEEVILRGEEQWQVVNAQPGRLRVPPTLTGVLQARLDSLSREELATIQRASVVGRIFWDSAVQRLANDQPKNETCALLQSLVGKGLIYQHNDSDFQGSAEYSFKHAILRDVTYEGVLRKVRRSYHAAMAAWIQEQSGARVGEYAALLALHYEQGNQPLLAGQWYAQAGGRAEVRYLPDVAAHHYQQALTLISDEPLYSAQRLDIYEALGLVLRNQARFEEAMLVYAAMRRTAVTAADPDRQVQALLGLAFLQDELGDHYASLKSVTRAEQVARRGSSPATRARALHGRGWVLHLLGRLTEAKLLGQEALSLSREIGDLRLVANCLNLLGTVAMVEGDYKQGVLHFEEYVTAGQQMGVRGILPIALSNLAEVWLAMDNYETALRLSTEAVAIAQQIGQRRGELSSLVTVSEALVGLGRYAEAEAAVRQALLLAGDDRLPFLVPTYKSLTKALLGQERCAEAATVARQALSFVQETEGPEYIAIAWEALTLVAAACNGVEAEGRLYTASNCYAEVALIYRLGGIQVEEARSLRSWAEYELQAGDPQRGRELWQQGYALFTSLGLVRELERMDAALQVAS